MTFAEPLVLLGLLALPLLLALDLWSRRRRARYAVAFTNLELLRAVAPSTTNWRRWLRFGLLLAALAALIAGLARPQVTQTVAKRRATVMLAIDTSGSMVANDVSPTRIAAATSAASRFVHALPSSFEVGLVAFNSTASVTVPPTRDRAPLASALRSLQANGGTAIGDAIELALQSTGGRRLPRGGRVILLLSDGANTDGISPFTAAAEAKRAGVRVYTIAFGTEHGTVDLGGLGGGIVSVPPDPSTLRAVARQTGGQFFSAADEHTLSQVYNRIGTRVGVTKERRDVSYELAAAGAVLLAAAGVLTIAWRSALT